MAYQTVPDKATGTTLKLGVQDRYDSTAGGTARRNDLNYSPPWGSPSDAAVRLGVAGRHSTRGSHSVTSYRECGLRRTCSADCW